MRLLSETELEGGIAHELAHVEHRDILISSVTATVAATIMMVARFAQFSAIFGGFGGRDDRGCNPIALLATIVVTPLAAMLIQAAMFRSREFSADRRAAQIVGSRYILADAFRKIDAAAKRVPLDANPATAHMFFVMPLSGRGVLSLFSTHPPTEQRIRALLGTF